MKRGAEDLKFLNDGNLGMSYFSYMYIEMKMMMIGDWVLITIKECPSLEIQHFNSYPVQTAPI